MYWKIINNFSSIFSQIEDIRNNVIKLYKLDSIFPIGIIAVICLTDTWKDMKT